MPAEDSTEATDLPPDDGNGLTIDSLTLAAGPRVLLRDFSLTIPRGQTHIIFGPNGTGKSTLLAAIMGLPPARVLEGDLRWRGRSLLGLSVTERVALGLGIAFQRPPAVSGLKLSRLAELIAQRAAGDGGEGSYAITERIQAVAEQADVTDLLDRDVNQGFSGGEMKRAETFQVALQSPRLVLLDEPESGVDVVNIERLGEMLRGLLQRDINPARREVSSLIITHSGYILNYLNADLAHVLYDGRIICRGSPRDVFEHVRQHGFRGCLECSTCDIEAPVRP